MKKNSFYFHRKLYEELKRLYETETDREARISLLIEMQKIIFELIKQKHGDSR